MFDYQTVRLLHHHGNQDWVAMSPATDHDPAFHDPERAWLEGATIYKCNECDEKVIIAPPDDRGETSPR